MSLLLIQIDSSNRIGTTFGTQASREACADYADTLRAIVPKGSPVIRLSDRRFAVLISPESESEARDLAELIAEAHQPEMHVADDYFSVDVTLGVAMCPLHADDAKTLFRRAELALKAAREEGESYAIYQQNATKHQATLWKLESDLKRAIAEGEMEVFFQPKVELVSNSVCGAEALVRWPGQDGRALSPGNFVPIAERTGAIVEMTWSVFDSVLEAVRSWGPLKSSFSLAINISPKVADHSEFYQRLGELHRQLKELNVQLAIELTEDSLLKNESRSMSNLHKIRSLGVDLSIDDFGKGYSSLTYLKQIPATEVKIDKRFISTIGIDETDQQIVKAIFDLAHGLGMKVVAEGVDSDQNLSKVADLGCDVAQGFVIARPMHGDDFMQWLDNYGSKSLELEGVDTPGGRGSEQHYG
jgi:EAL domain-containing protein (putative c-di-GMP-specific phosphodiesterase class I)